VAGGGNGNRNHLLPGQRSVSGWRKKQALVLAKAPVLGFELPTAIPGRRINCRRYEMCLDYAMAHDWYGFHCDACPVDDEYTQAELLERSRGAFSGDPETLFDSFHEGEKETSVSAGAEVGLEDAAARLDMGKNWCVRLGNAGTLKMRRDGDVVLFDLASLEEFKEARAKEEASKVKAKAKPAKAKPAKAPKEVAKATAGSSAREKFDLLAKCVAAQLMTAEEALRKAAALVG
jgi:hypothetical protein